MTNKRMSKAQFVNTLAEKSGLDKTQTESTLDAMNAIIAQQLGKTGPGEVLLPGLLSMTIVVKAATLQHEGINPFTKEPMTYEAKPARRAIKMKALKALKDAI